MTSHPFTLEDIEAAANRLDAELGIGSTVYVRRAAEELWRSAVIRKAVSYPMFNTGPATIVAQSPFAIIKLPEK